MSVGMTNRPSRASRPHPPRRGGLLAVAVAAAAWVGCGGGDSPSDVEWNPDNAVRSVELAGSLPATVLPGGIVEVAVRVLGGVGLDPVAGATVRFAPAQGSGSASPTVANTDGQGIARTQWTVGTQDGGQTMTASAGAVSVTAAVRVLNRAPEAVGTIAPVTVAGGGTTRVDVADNFMEPDGQALSYSASSSDPGVATASASGSTITVTAVGRGVSVITVTATDPGGLSATHSFQVTVQNWAPQAEGSIPNAELKTGESKTEDLGSYFTDPDGDALTYSATSSAPTVAAVSVAGRVLRITGAGSGTATITVTATDPDGDAATQSFQVTVPNRAPETVGTIPAQTAALGDTSTVLLRSYFDDPNGDVLTYTAASSDPAVTVATVSGSVLTIRAVGAGFSSITITATDPGGLSATQSFAVTVVNPDRDALEALYRATDGPNWTDNTNWLTDAPLGQWYGVTTDRAGRVLELDLSGYWDSENENTCATA